LTLVDYGFDPKSRAAYKATESLVRHRHRAATVQFHGFARAHGSAVNGRSRYVPRRGPLVRPFRLEGQILTGIV
jgi:hypothetical protein